MAYQDNTTSQPFTDIEAVPFDTAEEAWFWFVTAQAAKNDGARFVSGAGMVVRPCEPVDILKSVDRLYRNRRLLWDHVLVLKHYGVRQMAPDPRRVKEARAHGIWEEALERLSEVLERKGIVRPAPWNATITPDLFEDAFVK